MVIQRTKNATRNIVTGVINRMVVLLLPFITRTLMIKLIGLEYLGLNGLFSSILQVLSLAELGFGSAIVFSMYKPIVEDDTEVICALLNLYRKIYHIVGVLILIIGCLIIPFLKVFIRRSYPQDINIYIVYLIFLFNTVISYFLFAYRTALFSAHQRNDILNNISSGLTIGKYVLQIAFLLLIRNYYLYVIMIPICTIISNLAQGILSIKMYPNYVCRGKVSKEMEGDIRKRIKGLISYKVYGVVFNSVDTIVISTFLGLSVSAVYNNYYYVVNALIGFMTVLTSSMTAGVGNSLIKEDVKKNYEDFNKFTFINAWICGWCTVCLICMYQTFMKLWMGEKLLFPIDTMVLFAVFFFFTRVASMTYVYKEASGLWWEDRWRPIVAAVVNLTVNLFLIQKIGINGVILSTLLCTVFINIPWGSIVLFKTYFFRSPLKYFKDLGLYTVITFAVAVITYEACKIVNGDSIKSLLLKLLICMIVPNILFLICYFHKREFSMSVSFAKRIVSTRMTD